jgi:hypothetical protein
MGSANRGPEPGKQLEAIDSVATTLDRHGIDYWLFGGWAVDFWVGSITRPHDDIDIAAWRVDYDAIKAALLEAGWRHTPMPDEVVGTRYQWDAAVQVEFTFVVADETGAVVVPLPEQAVRWSPRPLGDTRRALNGVVARTLPLPLLKAGKERAREGAHEGEKDRADHAALLDMPNSEA